MYLRGAFMDRFDREFWNALDELENMLFHPELMMKELNLVIKWIIETRS